jgi:hypothetical protein
MNKGFIFSFSDMRTPTAAFNHRPKNLFGVILAEGGADGGGDAAADGGGNETFSLELMVNVVDMDDTRISSDSDSDWEPPNAKLPERGGPSAAPVDPAAVLARFREQVRNTMTPRGRAEKRGIGSYFVFCTFLIQIHESGPNFTTENCLS